MTECSHVLIRVADLHRAVAAFRDAGFEVAYAVDEGKALHAHIWFREGPIIELLTTPRGARWLRWPLDLFLGRGAGRRMVRWAKQSDGFCDVAVLVADDKLDGFRADLADEGLPSGRAVRWTRKRPDGAETRFRFSYPRDDRLPFLVTPYDPPQHPPEVDHANGATALATVVVDVRPEDESAYRRITGDSPRFRLVPAEVTGVREIELTGLTSSIGPMHGALFRPA